jgi:mRNA interferase HigB
MHVIKKVALVGFWGAHPAVRAELASWSRIILKSQFSDFNDLRKTFKRAGYVEGNYVFDVGQNYGLVAAIHFNTQNVFVRHVLTRAEYDHGKWKKT